MRQKVAKNNSRKRGTLAPAAERGSEKSSVGPLMLAFLVFVVVGSAVVQILNVLASDRTF